jgi:hypothetical protein
VSRLRCVLMPRLLQNRRTAEACVLRVSAGGWSGSKPCTRRRRCTPGRRQLLAGIPPKRTARWIETIPCSRDHHPGSGPCQGGRTPWAYFGSGPPVSIVPGWRLVGAALAVVPFACVSLTTDLRLRQGDTPLAARNNFHSLQAPFNLMLSEVLRARHEPTAGLSPLSTPDSILMCYRQVGRLRPIVSSVGP